MIKKKRNVQHFIINLTVVYFYDAIYDIRQKILNISYVDWKKLGFSKGTLHYMKQNAKSDKPFTLNSQVLERVNKWEALVSSQK